MGRTSVIAITQFVFLSLGSMAMRVLVAANAIDTKAKFGEFALFLTRHGWWLLLLPVAWAFFANVFGRGEKAAARLNVIHAIGCVMAAAIVVAFALPILFSSK
jgi:hypothetical protein